MYYKKIQLNSFLTNIPNIKPMQLDVRAIGDQDKGSRSKIDQHNRNHETGFALYPPKANPYNTVALGWTRGKQDLVDDFIMAGRQHDNRPGVNLGIRWITYLGIHNFKAIGTKIINFNAYDTI